MSSSNLRTTASSSSKRVFQSHEPFVLRYMVTTLLEPEDEDDPVPPTDDEIGAMFLYLKTVVDVLHGAAL